MRTIIHPAEARRRFREFVDSEITNANLAEGALLIALEEYPSLDIDRYLGQLDDLAARVSRRSSPGDPAIFRLGHLHAEMFDGDGYHGEPVRYYDPKNAFLNDVIDRRTGLPIALSIIFLHIAQSVGLTAAGVGLPGHYIVKVTFELNEVYVDPFDGGSTLTIPEISELLNRSTNRQVRLTNDHLRAWTPRQTLIRVLANLENMWRRAGDPRKAATAQERMLLLDASSPAR
jgi:regulator of sirC expression with transglutaminase-like and TPR domain